MLATPALLAHTNDLNLVIRHVLAGLGHGIHAGPRARRRRRILRVPGLCAGRRVAPGRLEAAGARRPLLCARGGARQPCRHLAVAGRQRLDGGSRAAAASQGSTSSGTRAPCWPAWRPSRSARATPSAWWSAAAGRVAVHARRARPAPDAARAGAAVARGAGRRPARRGSAARQPAFRALAQPGVRRQRLPGLAVGACAKRCCACATCATTCACCACRRGPKCDAGFELGAAWRDPEQADGVFRFAADTHGSLPQAPRRAFRAGQRAVPPATTCRA